MSLDGSSLHKPPLQVLLCSPRGFCAGVVRAIDTVERALALHGAPVYVRHEIVHNRYVVDSLRAKGAIFVEELEEMPGHRSPGCFPPMACPNRCRKRRSRRRLYSIDATCPLVTKVHREAELPSSPRSRHHPGRPCPVIPEVIGPWASSGRSVRLVETARRRETFEPHDPGNLAYVTQTTLSIDDTAEIVAALKRRFPEIVGPHKERHLLRHHQPSGCGQARGAGGRCHDRGRLTQLVQFPAAQGSCDAQRLPLRGPDAARRRYRLVEIRIRGAIGITAGASAPEVLVQEVVDAFAQRFALDIKVITGAEEEVFFPLPRPLRGSEAAE